MTEKVAWGQIMWRVGPEGSAKGFVWERPLRRTDLEQLGPSAPVGEIVAFRVKDEAEKQALLASEPDIFFTIPHLDGYPAVLALLERLGVDELTELITEAWLDRAPARLARAYLEEHALAAEPPSS